MTLLVLPQGHMPTHQLLRKYDLMQFADVTKAVRWAAGPGDRKWHHVNCGVHRCLFLVSSEGNLLLLNEALTKHETFFIRCGIFLILEKLKIITYRNLFKKVWVELLSCALCLILNLNDTLQWWALFTLCSDIYILSVCLQSLFIYLFIYFFAFFSTLWLSSGPCL